MNTARGELLDEQALLDLLSSGHIGGAALDVLRNEQWQGMAKTNPLVDYAGKHRNLIITPHIGGCTRDAMQKTEEYLARFVVEHLLLRKLQF